MDGNGPPDGWEFARTLERENAQLREALANLLDEYEDRRCQFGDVYLWEKHEHKPHIEAAKAALAKDTPTSPSDE